MRTPQLDVTEHRLGQVKCGGLLQRGQYPAEVTAQVPYGCGVRALVTKLSVDHKMPLEQISQLVEDLYGYALNRATLENILAQGYELAKSVEKQIQVRLNEANTGHFDETGVRVEGKRHWLHTTSTEKHTYLFVHEKRGVEALKSEASVLKDFKGTAVHDCWSPYFNFEPARPALCGAHLRRELAGLIERGSLWAEQMHEFLLDLDQMPRPITAPEQVRKHSHLILAQAQLEEPPPKPGNRGKPKQSTGRNLLNRLNKPEQGVLAFALEAGVPFTNNQAERDLRPTKVKPKVSGCFRTRSGARVYARLQGAVSTFRKPGINVFVALRDLFARKSVALN